jgi:hypothetical protein
VDVSVESAVEPVRLSGWRRSPVAPSAKNGNPHLRRRKGPGEINIEPLWASETVPGPEQASAPWQRRPSRSRCRATRVGVADAAGADLHHRAPADWHLAWRQRDRRGPPAVAWPSRRRSSSGGLSLIVRQGSSRTAGHPAAGRRSRPRCGRPADSPRVGQSLRNRASWRGPGSRCYPSGCSKAVIPGLKGKLVADPSGQRVCITSACRRVDNPRPALARRRSRTPATLSPGHDQGETHADPADLVGEAAL